MHKIYSQLHILTIHGNLPYGQQMALACISSICTLFLWPKYVHETYVKHTSCTCMLQFSCGNMYSKWMSVLYKYKLLKTLYLSKEIVDKSLRLIQKINMFNEYMYNPHILHIIPIPGIQKRYVYMHFRYFKLS